MTIVLTMSRVTRSPPELGLLDGAQGVEDGGFGDARSWRQSDLVSGHAWRRYPSAPDRETDPGRPDGAARALGRGRRLDGCESRTRHGPDRANSRVLDSRACAIAPISSAPHRRRLAGAPSEDARDRSCRRVVARQRDAAGVPTNVPAVDVRLVDVVKKFGDAVAVDHIDLEVQDGEFFSLLGPSGCGKTTTLRMIGGFEQPTSGLIELQGQDVTWLPPYQRNVNTVFQNYALFPHLTIFENVAFGLRRKGVKDSEVKRRVTDMLELVELPGFERRKPTQISGGQAQRVALARALINRPAVLLLDEPLGALDLKLRKQMQVELKRIQQEVGITFIYVTHDQEEAMTMSDRIAVMNKGRYEQLGDPESLYERPTTRFVAGFLGDQQPARRAPSRARDDGYAAVRLARRHGRPRPARRSSAATASRRRRAAREDPPARDRRDDVPDGHNRLTGVVRDASYLGVSTQYQVEARGGARLTVYEQNVERATRSELWAPGEEVRLTWSPDHSFGRRGSRLDPPPDPSPARPSTDACRDRRSDPMTRRPTTDAAPADLTAAPLPARASAADRRRRLPGRLQRRRRRVRRRAGRARPATVAPRHRRPARSTSPTGMPTST